MTSVWDTFCIGKTMTCDLQKKPADPDSVFVIHIESVRFLFDLASNKFIFLTIENLQSFLDSQLSDSIDLKICEYSDFSFFDP